MKYEVTSFGACVIDVFIYTGMPEKKKFFSYPVGSKILIEDLKFDFGGGGLNTSTTFSRMGLKTALITMLGKDLNGDGILSEIKKEKISFLGKRKEIGGFSIILDSKEHERTVLTYKGSNNGIDINDIPKNLETDWLYLSALLGKSLKAQEYAVKKLKKYGTKVVFNPSSYLIKKENLKRIIKNTDILMLNKEEARMLAGKNYVYQLLKYNKILCVTDGNNPFYCYTRHEKYKIFPHNVRVVERTGAGDAFSSGFVAGLVKEKDIEAALQIGVANSESVIRYFGSRNKILRGNEALKEIEKNPCKIVKSKV